MYTNTEYAAFAIKANESGKVLKVIKGKLTLEPIQFTDEQIVAQNTANQNLLLRKANDKIAILQRAVKYHCATDEEKLLLEQLELFTIDVARVDVSSIDVLFPEMP